MAANGLFLSTFLTSDAKSLVRVLANKYTLLIGTLLELFYKGQLTLLLNHWSYQGLLFCHAIHTEDYFSTCRITGDA